MSDEFGQIIRGLHSSGDTIVSTDTHSAVLAKKGTAYEFLEIDTTSGGLMIDIVDSVTLTVQATDLDIRDLTHVSDSVKVGDGTDFLAVNADGSINTVVSGSVTVTATDLDIRDLSYMQDSVEVRQSTAANLNATVVATDLDIRDLSHTQDSIKIGDGTDFLAINSDGSINVSISGAGSNNAFEYGSANLVKDTLTTVKSVTPVGAALYFKSILVSGAGLCEWQVLYGTTGTEAVIASFWTTPSSPTYHYDVPDSLAVSTSQTIIVKAYNREKAASPGSDFTGHATLVRQ